MFYGTFEEYEGVEAVEFNTKEELESWLRYEDDFSKAFGKGLYKRKELTDKDSISFFQTDPHVLHKTDFDGTRWLLFRPFAVNQ